MQHKCAPTEANLEGVGVASAPSAASSWSASSIALIIQYHLQFEEEGVRKIQNGMIFPMFSTLTFKLFFVCKTKKVITTSKSVYKDEGKKKFSFKDLFTIAAELECNFIEDSQSEMQRIFHAMTTPEQLVLDPFQRSRNEKLVLWSTRNNRSSDKKDELEPIRWLWLNQKQINCASAKFDYFKFRNVFSSNTPNQERQNLNFLIMHEQMFQFNSSNNDIIYMQMYRPDLESDAVYYFEQGFKELSTVPLGDYWFRNFMCVL